MENISVMEWRTGLHPSLMIAMCRRRYGKNLVDLSMFIVSQSRMDLTISVSHRTKLLIKKLMHLCSSEAHMSGGPKIPIQRMGDLVA